MYMPRKNSSLLPMLALCLLVLAGFLLRSYKLGEAPSGALIDEAHFGYIAHSLLQTGKDEHGVSWPLVFKGFGDQKLPLYAYLMLPVVALMPLTVLAIRIPSLLLGTASIIGMYLVTKEHVNNRLAALLAAAIMAFSPGMIYLSRFGFEANATMCVFIFGWWVLLKALKLNAKKYLVMAGGAWAITWYGYIAFRPVTFLLIMCSALYLFLGKKQRQAAALFISFGLLVLPWFLPFATSSNTARLKQVGITADPGIAMAINEQRTFCVPGLGKNICYGIFNKPLAIGHALVSRYLAAFSAPFLVSSGEADLHFLTVASFGQFQFLLYPLFIVGVLLVLGSVIPSRKPQLSCLLLCLGIVTALMPAMLSGEPQKVRLTPWWPFVVVTMIYGWTFIAEYLPKKKHIDKVIPMCLFVILVFEGLRYTATFTHFHVLKHDYSYQSYVPHIAQFVALTSPDTLITIKPFFSDPVMFMAFYLRLDPRYYQQHAQLGELEASGFQHTAQLANIVARSLEPEAIACKAQTEGYKKAILISDTDYPQLTRKSEFVSSNGVLAYARAFEVPLNLCTTP